MIKSWHIFISGYTENRQQATGLQGCWLKAKEDSYHLVPNQSETCFFPVLPWNHDWYTLARFIQINSNNTPLNKSCTQFSHIPFINIYAYSWGAGYGAIQLAQNLANIANYDIQNMVLADPVYCSDWLFMRWRAIFASRYSFTRRFAPKITIPSNVSEVFWSRQYNNWPRAHSLQISPSAETVIHHPNLETSLIHAEMDESIWFKNKVKELTASNG